MLLTCPTGLRCWEYSPPQPWSPTAAAAHFTHPEPHAPPHAGKDMNWWFYQYLCDSLNLSTKSVKMRNPPQSPMKHSSRITRENVPSVGIPTLDLPIFHLSLLTSKKERKKIKYSPCLINVVVCETGFDGVGGTASGLVGLGPGDESASLGCLAQTPQVDDEPRWSFHSCST